MTSDVCYQTFDVGMPPKHMSDDRRYDTSDVRYLM